MSGKNRMKFPNVESFPLKSLEDLLDWKPGVDLINVSKFDLRSRYTTNSRPLVISCHDFKGGYQEDRFSNLGAVEPHVYNFQYWELIDLFIYFSHCFITIPPPGWTEAAHQNGVRIMGTIITEWKEGKILMKRFLEFKPRKLIIDQLIRICKYYGFDGWFVNIENTVEDVPALKDFLTQFNLSLRLEGKSLLWYDSVISTGALKWQDSLNENNFPFFKLCDEGIFLNYTYTLEKIKKTDEFVRSKIKNEEEEEKEKIMKNESEVKRMKEKVFFGIDVFGRNTFPRPDGGKFNVDKAIKVLQEHDFQIAIFAPGWTFENSDGTREDFLRREKKFWEEKVLPYVQPRTVRVTDPKIKIQSTFTTFFSSGMGNKFWDNGHCLEKFLGSGNEMNENEVKWSNLRIQGVIPTNILSQQNVQLDYEDAYNGGNCLLFLQGGEYRLVRIDQDEEAKSGLRVEIILKFVQKDAKYPELVLHVGSKRIILSHLEKMELGEGWSNLVFLVPIEEMKKKEISFVSLKVFGGNPGLRLGGMRVFRVMEEEKMLGQKKKKKKMEILKYETREEEGRIALFLQWRDVVGDSKEFYYFNVVLKEKYYLGSTRACCCVVDETKFLGGGLKDISIEDISVHLIC